MPVVCKNYVWQFFQTICWKTRCFKNFLNPISRQNVANTFAETPNFNLEPWRNLPPHPLLSSINVMVRSLQAAWLKTLVNIVFERKSKTYLFPFAFIVICLAIAATDRIKFSSAAFWRRTFGWFTFKLSEREWNSWYIWISFDWNAS